MLNECRFSAKPYKYLCLPFYFYIYCIFSFTTKNVFNSFRLLSEALNDAIQGPNHNHGMKVIFFPPY